MVVAPCGGHPRISVRGEGCPPLAPQPLAFGPLFLPTARAFSSLPLSRGWTAPPPWLPFSIWKPKSLLQLGTVSFLCMLLAWWEDQNGDSNRLYEELAPGHVLCHCWFSVRELSKQVSRIRLSAPGPPLHSPLRLSTETAFRLINCNNSLWTFVFWKPHCQRRIIRSVVKAPNKFLIR